MKDIELQNEPTKVMPTLNEQKKYWDQRWEKEKTPNQWQIKQVEAIIPLIKKIPNRDLNILDLGCGTGWMTDMVKEFGHVRGIDLSETAIATAFFGAGTESSVAAVLHFGIASSPAGMMRRKTEKRTGGGLSVPQPHFADVRVRRCLNCADCAIKKLR